ncbi:MAG TPA: DinB family protein [Candidatus Paceibacterota bacterium]|nr:DinB family protein [Candidatus Paceibacterota bacterium]
MMTKQDILEEFNEEMPVTRKMLGRVPYDKPEFAPSPRSMPLGRLAYTVAGIPGWIVGIVNDDHIDLATYKMPPQPANVNELLAVFDGGVAAARSALAAMDDKTLADKWELRMKDKVLMGSTRGATLRQTINHLVHHRAQLGVYLKMNGIPHPAVYGASGDEGWG